MIKTSMPVKELNIKFFKNQYIRWLFYTGLLLALLFVSVLLSMSLGEINLLRNQ